MHHVQARFKFDAKQLLNMPHMLFVLDDLTLHEILVIVLICINPIGVLQVRSDLYFNYIVYQRSNLLNEGVFQVGELHMKPVPDVVDGNH